VDNQVMMTDELLAAELLDIDDALEKKATDNNLSVMNVNWSLKG